MPFLQHQQVPACRTMLPRRGVRLLDQDLRSHLLNCHGEDLRVLRNLAGDLYELGGSAGAAATSMHCPMAGCKHCIALPPPLPDPPPAGAAGAGGPAELSSPNAGRFLTGNALKGPSHTTATAVATAALPGSLELEVAVHLVSEHLLELQALAALSDSMTLRAFSRNACPFHALGPRACHGVHSSGTAAASGSTHGGGGAPVRAELGSSPARGSPTGPGGSTPGRKAPPAVTQQSPVVSPTKRLFLTSRPGTPTRSDAADGSLTDAGAGVVASARSPGSVDWWGHMRSHLPDLIATVGNVLQRCEEAAGSAADALSPRVACDVPGCAVHFQVSQSCSVSVDWRTGVASWSSL